MTFWRALRRPASCAAMLWLCGACHAQGLYLQAGDQALRDDIQLLVDERVLSLSSMAWPLPRSALAHALQAAEEPDWEYPELRLAWERVRSSVEEPEGLQLAVTTVVGQPGLARDFEGQAREEATLTVAAGVRNDSVGLNASLSAVSSATDKQTLRADGSELTLRVRNWLIGINALDRWWGPGQQGSLILSNNARPVNALTLERAEQRPSELRALRWVGPWHLTALAGVMDDRADFSYPLLMGLRFESVPRPWLDVAFERTAQLCGSGLTCNVETIGAALGGLSHDRSNAGARAGYTLSGVDVRAVSPWRDLPALAYAQIVGADEARGLPSKFMGLIGLEYWRGLASGATWRANLEYADTRCAVRAGNTSSQGIADCGYDSHLYSELGYRYLDRTFGYWTDSGAHVVSASLRFRAVLGALWSVKVLDGRLNSDPLASNGDNTLVSGPAGFRALEVGWKGLIAARNAHLQLGLQRLAPAQGGAQTSLYGFLGWSRNL